jgi:methionine sulfoxide reductase catalytic subunit
LGAARFPRYARGGLSSPPRLSSSGWSRGGSTVIFPATIRAATAGFPDALDPAFKLDGVKLTPYNLITSYNNFYEWGLSKEDPKEFANRGWKTEPWSVEIDGLCAKPARFDVNDLIKTVGGIEQRNYRHRCVEAWSMVIPWDGFPLAKLVAMAEPMAEAKFIKFTSFYDPAVCPGQRSNDFPWPYTEGLTIDEARNELAFLATGIYGKPLLNQNGAPIRLVVPWKYGFYSRLCRDDGTACLLQLRTWLTSGDVMYSVMTNGQHSQGSERKEPVLVLRFHRR